MLDFYKALADPTRLRLIAILDRGEFTVQELVEILAMGQSRVSRHLKILLEAGILMVKREGTWAYYRLAIASSPLSQQLPLLRESFAGQDQVGRDVQAAAGVLAHRRRRSQAFFDRHAHQWDHLVRELLPTPDYREQLLAAVPPCETLVEVGVGTGSLLEPLSRRARAVIGVDHSPAMLQAARDALRVATLVNVDLRLGEMEHLPLESSVADVVLLNMVLHHAASPEAVIDEMARVLRPGGRLLVVDLLRHQSEWVREKLADQWLGFTCDEVCDWSRRAGFPSPSCDVVSGLKGSYAVFQLVADRTC